MNRYVKLSAALLAGMLVSGVAIAEEHKYFECRVTKGVDKQNYYVGSCGWGNYPSCDEVFQTVMRYDFKDFEKQESSYVRNHRVEGVSQERIDISRANKNFSWLLIPLSQKNFDEPLKFEGTCELKTDKLKF